MTEPAPTAGEESRRRLHAVRDNTAPAQRTESSTAGADSEVPIGTSNAASSPEPEPTRETCTRARARNVVEKVVAHITNGERWRRVRHRLWGRHDDRNGAVGGVFRPPDVWTTDRPSLRKQVNYARFGVQHPPRGPLRALSVLFAYVGVVIQAGLYYLAWIAERPGRLLTAYGLFTVLMQVPAVRTVLVEACTVLLTPITWLA